MLSKIKQCSICKIEKSLDCFHSVPRGKYGKSSRCKVCCSQTQAQARLQNPKRYQQQLAALNIIRDKYKEKNLCRSCGAPTLPNKSKCFFHCVGQRLRFAGRHLKLHKEIYIKNLTQPVCDMLTNNPICPYTKQPLIIGVNAQLDHKQPVKHYPEKALDLDNLQWVSEEYNEHKLDMTDEQYLEHCKTIIKSYGYIITGPNLLDV